MADVPRSSCLATNETVFEATRESLASGASALAAALSGYFVAAGGHPGVLLAPFSLLVGGVGAGAFAYDGRCRQPGRDAKRPRGFVEADEVPVAARAAAPTSAAAAFVACAFHPSTSFLSCVRPGIARARQVESKGRAALLEIVASRGAGWLTDPAVKRAMVAQFGVVEGGLMTSGDLLAPEGLQVPALKNAGELTTPWIEQGESASAAFDLSESIVACDSRGLFAALSYGVLGSQCELEGFEVSVPLLATPVLRGVSRVSPGAPLPMRDRLRLVTREGESIVAAEAGLPTGARLRLDRDSTSKEVIVRRIE